MGFDLSPLLPFLRAGDSYTSPVSYIYTLLLAGPAERRRTSEGMVRLGVRERGSGWVQGTF